MSKLITLCGPDGIGKTTLAYALADRLVDQDRMALIVHTDFRRPVISERMPALQRAFSLGQILITGDFTLVEKSLVSYPVNKNVFATGILNDENVQSYERCAPDTAEGYLKAVSSLFDYILVDATDDITDTLAMTALARSGLVLEVLPPDIQGTLFHRAYLGLFTQLGTGARTIYIADKVQAFSNTPDAEKAAGIRFQVSLPYSDEVAMRTLAAKPMNGFVRRPGRAYAAGIDQLCTQIGR